VSTISTQLNWGASYLVSDVYLRFLNPSASERRRVAVSRGVTVLLFVLSAIVTQFLGSIEGAWRLLLALGAGTGLVYILRWYWWRINAWSEISAMVASLVVSLALQGWFGFDAADPTGFAWLMLLTVATVTIVWIAVTFLTAPVPDATLHSFYTRVRPGGPGWRRIASAAGFGAEAISGGALNWTNWVAGVTAVYATLFGVGSLLLHSTIRGVLLLGLAVAAFGWIARSLRSTDERPVQKETVVEPSMATHGVH
jgi:SSS family solute:Na+ symporter